MTAVTFDPSAKSADITLSNGNLTITSGSGAQDTAKANLFEASGKWYCEILVTTAGSDPYIGVCTTTQSVNALLGNEATSYSYRGSTGNKFHGTPAAYGATWTNGDRIGMEFDATNGTLEFFKNGTTQGVAYTGMTAGSYTAAISTSNAITVMTADFGATAFVRTPNAGFAGWDSPAPTPGIGTGAMQKMTAVGSRLAAGAGVMSPMTAAGGRNGFGTAVMQPMTVVGAGGPHYGQGTMLPMTAAATGHQAAYSGSVMTQMTAAGTGHDSSINTFVGIAPAPRLVSTVTSGEVITVTASAPMPLLVATLVSPAVITFAGTARAPRLSAQILTGNAITFLGTVAAPIMVAAGHPAYTITFAGTAPAPRLSATLNAATLAAFRTWVLNTRKGALSEYGSEWAFNSYTFFNGKVLGCGSAGIVELGLQGADNTTPITARVRTGQESFASSFHKRVPRIYTSGNFSGDMIFRTITDEGGTRSYLLGWNNATGLQQRRVPVGKGPKSRFFSFEYENVNGSDFGVNDLLVYPVHLRRRVQ
jgi:SPRY domain